MNEPRPESRISFLEKQFTTLGANVEELAQDTDASFRGLKQDNKALFEHVQAGFGQAHAFVQEQFDEIRGDIAELKSAQAEQGKKLDQILQLLQQKSGS